MNVWLLTLAVQVKHAQANGIPESDALIPVQAKAALLSLLNQIPLPEIPHGEEGLFESIYLLLTSVIVVPLVCKLPGGSPVLGFLVSSLPYLLGNSRYLPGN